jgi:hypothetical protein
MNEVIYSQWGIYLDIKNNRIMSSAGKWVEFEIIIPSEISLTQKDKYNVVCYM